MANTQAIGSVAGAGAGMAIGGPAGMALGSTLGGVVGGLFGSDGGLSDDALNQMRQAAAQYNGIIPPEVKALYIEKLQQAGLQAPEAEQVFSAGVSKVGAITEDSNIKNAQMSALTQMGQASRTGLRPEDRMAMLTANNAVARDAAAKNAQLQQQLQATGRGGISSDLIMQLQGSQQGANSASDQQDQMNALASQNALAALGQYGTMSSQNRAQDFQNQATKATAADEFNRFNVQNRQNVMNSNVGARNQAQAGNLSEAQRIADTNASNIRNEAVRQEQAKQTKYENELAVAKGKANAATNLAQTLLGQDATSKQGTANTIGGVIAAGTTAASMVGGSKAPSGAAPINGVVSGSDNTKKMFDANGNQVA